MSSGAGGEHLPDSETVASPPSDLDSEFKIRTPSPATDLDSKVKEKNAAQPKDPRSKHKYNIFFRFFFL